MRDFIEVIKYLFYLYVRFDYSRIGHEEAVAIGNPKSKIQNPKLERATLPASGAQRSEEAGR